jgi:hypothetical protein
VHASWASCELGGCAWSCKKGYFGVHASLVQEISLSACLAGAALILCRSGAVLLASREARNSGGTWSGVVDNLRNALILPFLSLPSFLASLPGLVLGNPGLVLVAAALTALGVLVADDLPAAVRLANNTYAVLHPLVVLPLTEALNLLRLLVDVALPAWIAATRAAAAPFSTLADAVQHCNGPGAASAFLGAVFRAWAASVSALTSWAFSSGLAAPLDLVSTFTNVRRGQGAACCAPLNPRPLELP